MPVVLATTIALSAIAADYPADLAYEWSWGSESGATPTEIDPVSMATGAFFEDWSLFSLGGPMPLYCTLHYRPELWNHFPVNRAQRLDNGFGVFTCNHNIELIAMTNRTSGVRQVHVQLGDHEEVLLYDNNSQTYVPTGSAPFELKILGAYYYLSNPQTERVYMFRAVPDTFSDLNGYDCTWWGRVETVMDRRGNTHSYTYTADALVRLAQISDGLGREINLNYHDWGGEGEPLQSITDGNGRTNSFTTGFDTFNETFSSMTDPLGHTTQFEAGSNNHTRLISRIVRPEGNSHINQSWTSTPKGEWFFGVETQYDAYSNRSDITYGTYSNGDTRVVFTYPDGSTGEVQNVKERYPGAFTDRTGNQAEIAYNGNHQISVITDRLGDTTTLTHHPETGRLASFTNALGNGINHSYTATSQTFTNPVNSATVTFTFHDRTRTDYPDGTHETIAYDDCGNPTNRIDRSGANRSLTHNTRGQLLTATNPQGGTITRTYNPDGTLATMTDSETVPTAYTYDVYKRPNGITPGGAAAPLTVTYDLKDRLKSITQLSQTTSFDYDDNGNLIRTTDANAQEISYSYDLMDRLSKTVSRTSGTNQIAYNFDNTVTATTNANGIASTIAYDKSRNPISIRTGETAAPLTMTYDLEDVLSSATTPAGRTVHYETDAIGNIKSITSPNGETSRITRESMTRIASTTDPLNRQTQYSYDGMGRLEKVTLPDTSSATYTRNALGSLINISDLNGADWRFTYTPMGRLLSTVDPLSRTNTYARDILGRVSTITYTDGTTASNTYDTLGNTTAKSYTGGTTPLLSLTYAYDVLNNLTNTTHLALTRDANERITSSTYNSRTFGVTRDAGGRITTATYEGAFTVSYAYDAKNRLAQVADTFGNALVFDYDADGNPIAISRSNGLGATYTWDINGRLSRLRDAGIIDLSYTHDAAGQITAINGTYPIATTPANSTTLDYTVDAASQINAPGYAFDDRGRATALPGHSLGWDAAERLAGLDGTTTFTYNGLHQIASRTEGSTTTHYHHNHAFRFAPIVAEEQNAAIVRYYIHTPSGQLLYSITPAAGNAVTYYHRDHLGSTLALSDASGTLTDRYAYSPYGEILAHTGPSTQPFTFVGAWGVRQEGDLYQMRRRYYDPATARFLSKEPIWPQVAQPALLNPYQYVLGNPISAVDGTGLDILNDLWAYTDGVKWEKPTAASPPFIGPEYQGRWDYDIENNQWVPANQSQSPHGGIVYSDLEPDETREWRTLSGNGEPEPDGGTLSELIAQYEFEQPKYRGPWYYDIENNSWHAADEDLTGNRTFPKKKPVNTVVDKNNRLGNAPADRAADETIGDAFNFVKRALDIDHEMIQQGFGITPLRHPCMNEDDMKRMGIK